MTHCTAGGVQSNTCVVSCYNPCCQPTVKLVFRTRSTVGVVEKMPGSTHLFWGGIKRRMMLYHSAWELARKYSHRACASVRNFNRSFAIAINKHTNYTA